MDKYRFGNKFRSIQFINYIILFSLIVIVSIAIALIVWTMSYATNDNDEYNENSNYGKVYSDTVKNDNLDDFEYELLEDGTAELTVYNGEGGSVVIPDSIDTYTVTSLGYQIFEENGFFLRDPITDVTFPNTLKNIGPGAFMDCDELSYVDFPDSLVSIESGAFSGCDSLDNVVIGKNISSVNSSFSGNSLSNVKIIKEGIDFCGNAPFHGPKLTSAGPINSGCNFEFSLNDKIPESFFRQMSDLENVYLPESITIIEDFAFNWCEKLNFPVLPANISSIGDSAFSYTACKNVVLSEKISYIGCHAFAYCEQLESIKFKNPNAEYGYNTGICTGSNLLKTGGALGGGYDIEVAIDDRISYGPFTWSSISSITIPETVKYLDAWCFSQTDLSAVVLPNCIEEIGNCAFEKCYLMQEINFPDSLRKIGSYSFWNCTSLMNLYIPAGVEEIQTCAFTGCDKLAHIVFNRDNYGYGASILSACPLLKSVGPIGEDYDIEIAFISDTFNSYLGGSSIESAYIPDNVTAITYECFSGCANLQDIKLPNNLKEIPYTCFSGCAKLTHVDIPGKVTNIGTYAFRSSGITELVLPPSIVSLDQWFVNNCSKLEKVVFMGNAPEFARLAFEEVTIDAYYPGYDPTWTEEIRQDYGGDVTWIPMGPTPGPKYYLNIPKDAYGFNNPSGETISIIEYIKRFKLARAFEVLNENACTKGLCFGIVSGCSLINLLKKPGVSSYNSAQNLSEVDRYCVSSENNISCLDYIKSLFLAQYVGSIQQEKINNYVKPLEIDSSDENKDKLNKVLTKIYFAAQSCAAGHSNINVGFSFHLYDESYENITSGHIILPIGIESETESVVNVAFYDPNDHETVKFVEFYRENGKFYGFRNNDKLNSEKADLTPIMLDENLITVSDWTSNSLFDYTVKTTSNSLNAAVGEKTINLNNTNFDDTDTMIPVNPDTNFGDNVQDYGNHLFYFNNGSKLKFSNVIEDTSIDVAGIDTSVNVDCVSDTVVETNVEGTEHNSVKLSHDNQFTSSVTFNSYSINSNDEIVEDAYSIDSENYEESTFTYVDNKHIAFNGVSQLTVVHGEDSIEQSNLNPEKSYVIEETEGGLKIVLDINDAEVEPIENQTYTGSALSPLPVVKYGENTLIKGVDYTVSYKNNVNAGSATVVITGMGSYAYEKEVNFTIDPRNIVVMADNKTKQYRDLDPQYTGVCYEEDEETPVVNPPVLTFNRQTGEDLGTYNINASTTNTNFNISKTTGTLTIEAKDVKVVANNVFKTYADQDPVFTGIVTDMQDIPIANPPVIIYSRAEGENVGEYNISALTENENFDINSCFGKLTILTKKINRPNVLQIRYNGNEQCGIEDSDWYTIADVNGVYPGDYTSNVSLNDISNTSWWDDSTSDIQVDWSIDKAIITATYPGEEIQLGSTPKLTIEISGFVNGETEKTAAGYVAPQIDEPSSLGVGEYVITPYGGEADNYEFSYVPGTLKVVSEVVPASDVTDASKTGDATPIAVVAIIALLSICVFYICRTRTKGEHIRH